MNRLNQNPLEKTSHKLSNWIDSASSFNLDNISSGIYNKKYSKRNFKAKNWGKRLELFFGFIPALLLFVVAYGKRFR